MSPSQLPQHPIDAHLSNLGTRWLLVLERTLPDAPRDIWAALTEREQVKRWAPFDPDRDLTETGPIGLPVAGEHAVDSPGQSAGTIVTVAPQRMLSLVWGADAIDIELAPTASATVVRLSHTFDDRAGASSYAAGWHLCLMALEGVASGLDDVPRMVGEDAKLHGWNELQEKYAELFGD